jgi:hypothetical protein
MRWHAHCCAEVSQARRRATWALGAASKPAKLRGNHGWPPQTGSNGMFSLANGESICEDVGNAMRIDENSDAQRD